MQNIADFVNSQISNYNIDSSDIQNVQACLGKEMKQSNWISIMLCNRVCVLLKFNNGVFMNEGFVVNDQKVLKEFGKHPADNNLHNKVTIKEGIVDLDHGSRFEGLVLKDEKEGKIGIPFGYGEMYDDNGLLMYKGIMINWKRFGYGTSYHDNGLIEYEGYWCDDNRFGRGNVYDRKGAFLKDRLWYNGIESDIYEGNGSDPINIGIKHLKLTDNCVLVDWDVSWLLNLESIEIGNDCFGSVQTFRIDGLNRLKTVKIGRDSFTQIKQAEWDSKWSDAEDNGNNRWKSFHILNCESLESIEIGEYSFNDFGGEFELKNLPQLQSIQIGTVGSISRSFYHSSFVIRGIDMNK